MIPRSLVLTHCQRMTDRRTDTASVAERDKIVAKLQVRRPKPAVAGRGNVSRVGEVIMLRMITYYAMSVKTLRHMN